MDKKQKDMVFTAMIKMFIVIYIVVFTVGMYKLCSGVTPADCFWELVVIFLLPVIGYFVLHFRRKVYFPRSIAGLHVRSEGNGRAFCGRIRAYILDSLLYAVVITALVFAVDLWEAHSSGILAKFTRNEWLDMTKNMLLEFAVFFAAFFIIDLILYEIKAKKYREQKRRRKKREREYKEKMRETTKNETI